MTNADDNKIIEKLSLAINELGVIHDCYHDEFICPFCDSRFPNFLDNESLHRTDCLFLEVRRLMDKREITYTRRIE